MKTSTTSFRPRRSSRASRAGAFLLGMLAALSSLPAASVDIAQTPLSIARDVPGNLALVPSVEYPTIHSQANIGFYDVGRSYMGYFDPGKCYEYVYSDTESERHFRPVALSSNRTCAGANRWSGNFLTWAATQTIDPFRLALTGGYRVKDTPTTTWLEKARHAPGFGLYPNRRIPETGDNSTLVDGATPAAWSLLRVRIAGLNNKMYFTRDGNLDNPATPAVAYDPAVHGLTDNVVNNVRVDGLPVYEVSMRVEVCNDSVGLEANCKRYSQGYKPEGLIQEYSDRLRYSIFGYLNDSAWDRDGGVLRARQKFVGPLLNYPNEGTPANPNTEWDSATGVLYDNPDATDATATGGGVNHSGVINYLNRFGQMTTNNPKTLDPVSELYYAAVRYFKNQGNVPAYSNMTGDVYGLADGFPVITQWDDPIKYSCQINVILGIGDVYTHRDKNLPGNTPSDGEPGKPTPVSDDATVDVVRATQKVFDLEGLGNLANPFTGRQNSAYIAGLAYDSHTRDIRPDDNAVPQNDGMQTISTHWVDVRENQILEPRDRNQYWLAAKYGGFRVPATGFDPYTHTEALDPTLWHNTTDYLNSGAQGGVTSTVTTYLRPDNFYVASEADKMVLSLRRAFENIMDEMRGSGGSFAANSTKLETGAMVFQAQFWSGSWRGELSAYNVVTPGVLTSAWNASNEFPAWASRSIYVNNDGTQTGYKLFTYPNLSSANASALQSQAVVDYLRGDRSNEAPSGIGLRTRQSILGDIVNSQPVFVGAPNGRLFYGQEFTGADDYGTYVTANAARTKVVYVGANDGMLHGFDAETGSETYAFVPKAAIDAGLRDYARPDYLHRYFVDGEVTVADAYVNGAWKTILVGTMGRGGKGIYALDITDPNNVNFLWEKSATDIPRLGNVIGKPVIAQVADNDWRVLLGNGPNGTGDGASLITVRLGSGNVSTIPVGTALANGLSAVNAWSTGATDFVDAVYAGDLQGGMWKITNLTGTPTVMKLFQADRGGSAQPISASPLVAKNPADGTTWVFFGTGRYLNAQDLADKSVQTWYGLIDDGTAITAISQLVQTSIVAEIPATSTAFGRRLISANSVPGPRGWYLDLLSPLVGSGGEGERMVVPNFFQGLDLVGTSRVPDTTNVCNPGGKGWVMALNPFTGGRLGQSFFDVNGDGEFNAGDEINNQSTSGVGTASGANNPTVMGDVMLLNLDNAQSKSLKLNSSVLAPSRVSWREVVGD